MFLTLLVITLILIALAFIGLGINILFKKNGKFPETSVGHNPEMKKMGLSCAKQEEIKDWNKRRKNASPDASLSDDTYPGCAGCSCSD